MTDRARWLIIFALAGAGCSVVPPKGKVFDPDGDGVTWPGDCDNADKNTYPGAEETAYDGVDNDCDHQTRDDDLDEDDFNQEDDCDDQDGDVYPGHQEVVYDGLDNDCDPETLDDDRDLDGYPVADDCDDTDGEVHPGSEETPYDGVDNDCDPETPDDDLDGDGYDEADDCDDDDDSINPDAFDDCGGVDEDCDGFDPAATLGGVDYLDIQDAVDSAGDGDTVHICPGTYVENIYATNSITIEGESDSSTATIDGTGLSGSVITAHRDLTLRYLTITNGTGSNIDGVHCGGGIYLEEDVNLVLDRVEVTGNDADRGAGIYLFQGGSVTGGTVSYNMATAFGSGIYLRMGGDLTDIVIEHNGEIDGVPEATGGGGVFISGEVSTTVESTLTGLRLKDNKASDGAGGLFIETHVYASDLEITDNESGAYGGGIGMNVAFLSIDAPFKIEHNSAPYGGGLYLWSSSEVILSGGTVTRNNADLYGGGVRINGAGEVIFESCGLGDGTLDNFLESEPNDVAIKVVADEQPAYTSFSAGTSVICSGVTGLCE